MKKRFLALFLCIPLLLTACGPAAMPSGQPLVTITSEVLATGAGDTLSTPAGTAPSPAIPPDPQAPLWAASPVDGAILRIDPLALQVTQVISVEGRPEMVVSGEGGLWALDIQNNLVLRLDPEPGRVTDRIVLPVGRASTLTVGAGFVWVGMTGPFDAPTPARVAGQDEEVQAPGWVAQIDPDSRKVAATLDVQPVSDLALYGGYLWVLSVGVIDTPLQILDLSRQVGMVVPLRNAPDWLVADALAVDDSGLWLFSAARESIFHASTDGKILAAVPVPPGPPTGYADLLLAYGSLWAATPWGSVLRVDLRTNQVLGQVDLRIPLSGLIAGGGYVWASSPQTGALVRIDPSGSQVSGQVATGHPLPPTVIPTPTSSVVVWQPCPGAPASRLKVGDIAYVNKENDAEQRVRKEPNREAEILGNIRPGAAMDIIGGPTCADGWVWWNVRNADMTGWSAEGDQDTYWLVPLKP